MGIFSDDMTGDGSSGEPCVNQDSKEGKDPAMQRAEERAFQVEGTWCTESLVSPSNCEGGCCAWRWLKRQSGKKQDCYE